MKIKRCPVVFHNVLSVKITSKVDEWYIAASDFRNRILTQGFYATGPVIYQVHDVNEEDVAQYTLYIPINAAVELDDNDKYKFYEEFYFKDALVLRHADLEEDIDETYEMLTLCANELNLKVDGDFYNIYLDVYGDGIIDVFLPIGADQHD